MQLNLKCMSSNTDSYRVVKSWESLVFILNPIFANKIKDHADKIGMMMPVLPHMYVFAQSCNHHWGGGGQKLPRVKYIQYVFNIVSQAIARSCNQIWDPVKNAFRAQPKRTPPPPNKKK